MHTKKAVNKWLNRFIMMVENASQIYNEITELFDNSH